jgi:hypothetical protein
LIFLGALYLATKIRIQVKDSNLSLSRKISQKIRIFESGFADSTQH